MKISDISRILDAQIICGKELYDKDFSSACGSDLMSDVMAFVKDQGMLLTGLINIQVIRTANLMDIGAICFVRGKLPNAEMIEMAKELGIVLMTSKLPLFSSCGLLFNNGLHGGTIRTL